jgi:hypothetical protein
VNVDHSLPASADVKKTWVYTPTSWLNAYLVKKRDNFLPKRNRWSVLIYWGFEGLAAVDM